MLDSYLYMYIQLTVIIGRVRCCRCSCCDASIGVVFIHHRSCCCLYDHGRRVHLRILINLNIIYCLFLNSNIK